MSTTTFSFPSQNIYDIVNKNYQNRTANQHTILTETLQSIFVTLSPKLIKLLSFYVAVIQGPTILTNKDYSSQSFIINPSQNPEQPSTFHNLTKQSKITLQQNQQALLIDYQHYLNCMTLDESSIQQEINFMHSSEFMCSIPKKRLYFLMRNARIVSYSMAQCIYCEGQKIQAGESGSGVYFVRRGDFGYFKRGKEGKEIQTLRFSKGHIIGTLQVGNHNNSHNQQPQQRIFTVRCKSSRAIVYNFTQQIFISHIKPYCQQYLTQRQGKLMKYLDLHLQKVSQIRSNQNHLLTQNLTRRFSMGDNMKMNTNANMNMNSTKNTDLPILNRTKMYIPNKTSRTTTLSQQLQQQGLRKTTYMSAMKQGPLKQFPMASQRSTFTESEFKDFIRLERNKQQCQKIKKLNLRTNPSNRGEILFTFFKKTWLFEKQKMHNRRYH